jgi:phosphoglycerate dehydrogenase-like enzyme
VNRSFGGAPTVLVAGATSAEHPPDLAPIADLAVLRFGATPEDVAEGIDDAEVVFAWRADGRLLEDSLDRARRLRWIQSASAGVDRLLVPAIIERDIVVTNAHGVFDDAMAEYAIACMLAFAKDLPTTITDTGARAWRHRETEPLTGRRLVAVGAGSIGTAVARKARALGMRVEGVASVARPARDPFERVVGTEALHDALGRADYVVDVLPLTPRTRHAFDAAAFRAMRPTARFLNLGRGATVDETALIDALDRGGIAGAAIDVVEAEPLASDSPLWGMAGVIVSPHMSGDVSGWEDAVVDLFRDNLDRYVTGRPLRGVVDKARGYVPTA